MKKFEYNVIALETVLLDNMGQDGWELVTIFNGKCFFKREMIGATTNRVTISRVINDIDTKQIKVSSRVKYLLRESLRWQEKTYLDEIVMPSRNFGEKSKQEWIELYKKYQVI